MTAQLDTRDAGDKPEQAVEKVAAATHATAAAGTGGVGGSVAGPPAATEAAAGLGSVAGPPAATEAAAGLGSAAAVAEQRAAARQAAAQEVRFDRHLALCSFTLHTATQFMSLLAWASLPGSERFQRVLSIFFAASMYVLHTVAPVTYLRWRAHSLGLYRIAFFAFPLLRKARGIQKVLDADPQPGLHGALKDLFKVVWGSRLVAVFLSSLMTPLPLMPLVPHLLVQVYSVPTLVQVYSVALVRANDSLCATPLLAHPATAARISALHQAMHLASMVLPGSIGQSISPALQASQQGQQCEAILTFLFIVTGLLFPIACLLATEPAHSLHAWEARRQQQQQQQQQQPGGGRGGLRGVVSRAAAALEHAVRELCGSSWLAGRPPRSPSRQWSWPPPAGTSAAQQGSGSASPGSAAASPSCELSLHGWQRAVGWWLLLSLAWAAPFALVGGGA
ncbi:hypothetical protein ABPG75_006950 [Micractinium tetrahymenae]